MSKFFNESRKNPVTPEADTFDRKLDLEQSLAQIRERKASPVPEMPAMPADASALISAITSEAIGTDMAEFRLEQCRKVPVRQLRSAQMFEHDDEYTQAAVEAYRTLRTRLMRAQVQTGIHSVVVTSAVQGEGKTMTAVHLGLCCAQLHNNRVLLVDADLRTGGLAHALGYPSGPGLSELLAGDIEYQEAITATDLPNLFVVPPGRPGKAPAELFADHRWKEFIGWSSETFKTIIVDATPVIPLADFELIAAPCDGILAVVLALQTQRELLEKAAGCISQQKLVGVVFNGVDTRKHNRYYHYYYGGSNGSRSSVAR